MSMSGRPDDEATVERMAEAIHGEDDRRKGLPLELPWDSLHETDRDYYRDLARVALTAAQEGER